MTILFTSIANGDRETMRAHILIIDDEESIRFSLRGILEDEGYTVFDVGSGTEAFALLEKENIDLCMLDLWLPDLDGMAILSQLSEQYSDIPVIMISGHGTIETAVTALKLGAYDFIEKPFSLEKVLVSTVRALEFKQLKKENTILRNKEHGEISHTMLGRSDAIQSLQYKIERVAPTQASVLITGENGTGKELTARMIHAMSSRKEKPFIAVNCAAIPEELIESELFGYEKGAFTGATKDKMGRFEMADGGTLFLDEIGDMTLKVQVKLLRVLEERVIERLGGTKSIAIDVRIIAATNKNLEEAIITGDFREDLYYRLRVFPIHIPALRERKEDIPILLNHFSTKIARQYGVTPLTFSQETQQLLMEYQWPGNIRELRNFVERMFIVATGTTITPALLPQEYNSALSIQNTQQWYSLRFKDARAAFEKEYLLRWVERTNGNMTQLAERIGLERSYLYKKLKLYAIL